jgi:hypothetical protein
VKESAETLLARIDERTLATDKKLDSINSWLVAHERRLTTLEKWQAKIIGIGVASGAFFGWLFGRKEDAIGIAKEVVR